MGGVFRKTTWSKFYGNFFFPSKKILFLIIFWKNFFPSERLLEAVKTDPLVDKE